MKLYFNRAEHSYEENAKIQEKMQDYLIFYITKYLGKNFNDIFEFGSHTGSFTKKIIHSLNFKYLICNDIFEFGSHFKKFPHVKFLRFDIQEFLWKSQQSSLREFLKSKDKKLPIKFDLVTSNATLQWLDSQKTLKNLPKICKKNSILALGSFGPYNLKEIYEIFGVGLKYPDREDLIKQARKGGFECIHSHEEILTLDFPSPLSLLNHLKATGVNSLHSNFKIKKSHLQELDSKNNSLTYHPIFLFLRKKN